MSVECCDPSAPMKPCRSCGKMLHTCEREEPDESSYLCPVEGHNEGSEDSSGRWLCERCSMSAVGKEMWLSRIERIVDRSTATHLTVMGKAVGSEPTVDCASGWDPLDFLQWNIEGFDDSMDFRGTFLGVDAAALVILFNNAEELIRLARKGLEVEDD